jgi:hypothetical protein
MSELFSRSRAEHSSAPAEASCGATSRPACRPRCCASASRKPSPTAPSCWCGCSSTTMPLIMMMLWTAVTRAVAAIASRRALRGPAASFVAYFLDRVHRAPAHWLELGGVGDQLRGAPGALGDAPAAAHAPHRTRTLVREPGRPAAAHGPQGACGASVLHGGRCRAARNSDRPAVAALFAGSMLGGWLITFLINIGHRRAGAVHGEQREGDRPLARRLLRLQRATSFPSTSFPRWSAHGQRRFALSLPDRPACRAGSPPR